VAVRPAVGVLVAGLVIWNVMLQRELVRRAPGPAPGPEVEALSRRPGQVVIFKGSGVPGANARLFVASDGGYGHLAISGLPVLPQSRTYQVWFLRRGAAPTTGATFAVDRSGRAWVSVNVPAPFADVRAIMVTEEAAPRGDTPTGIPVVEAQLLR
jgi:hypothetical protein